jgi:hypothetical protein
VLGKQRLYLIHSRAELMRLQADDDIVLPAELRGIVGADRVHHDLLVAL